MSDLELLTALDFESFGADQYETLEVNDGARRLPTGYMASGNYDSGKAPYILNYATGFGYNLKGLHCDISGSDNGRKTGAYYLSTLQTGVELASFVMVRIFGGYVNMGVAPAVRMDPTTNPGRSCYTAELTWNAGTVKFDLEICKYDAAGTRTVLSTLAGAISAYPVGSGNFGDRYYAVGIKAVGTGGTVTLSAWLHMMFFTQQPTYNPFAPGTPPPRHLSALPSNSPSVLSVADSSTPLTSGAHGIRWRDQTGGYNVTTAHTQSRLALEWGLFMDIAATRPSQPQNLIAIASQGNAITAYASGFADTDPADSHVSSRWLLYQFNSTSGFDFPLVDTGFLTGSKTSYTFDDLAPGGVYRYRVQFRDSDGDVSQLSDYFYKQVDEGLPLGMHHAVDFFNAIPHSKFPRLAPYAFYERPGITDTTPYFKLRDAGFTPGLSPDIGQGPTIRRFDSVAASGRIGVVYRDPSLVQGQPGARYGQVMATMVVVKWGDDTGLQIGVRHTASDTDGFYVKKVANGSNYWDYVVKRRALAAGGVAGVGPYTETTLFTKTLNRVEVGLNGERIILAHYLSGTTPVVALWVNGIYCGAATDGYLAEWLGDGGHAWSAVEITDKNGDWNIVSIGQCEPITGFLPQLPITVPVPARDTGSLAAGCGLNHVGPFMDGFDFNQSFVAWFSVGGVWCCMDVTGAGTYAFLVYWAPQLASYDYAVRATIYSHNGLVARFTSIGNFIAAFFDLATGKTDLVLFINGVAVATYEGDGVYSAGQDLVLQVANSSDADSTAIEIRVFYNGLAVSFGANGVTGGPYTTQKIVYDGGAGSVLRSGRFGFIRNGAHGATNGEQVGGDLYVTAASSSTPPNAPSILSKHGDTAQTVSVILAGSAFSDPDSGSSQSAAQWQVTTMADTLFSSVIFDSGVTTVDLTAVTVPSLSAGTTYRARVRYRDEVGLWSSWSDSFTFTTDLVDSGSQPSSDLTVFPLDPKPAQTYVRNVGFDTLVTKFQSGRRQATGQRTAPLYAFDLKFGPLSDVQIDVLWDFYVARQGRLEPFVYVDQVTGTAYIVAFADDRMSREMFEWKVEQASLTLEQVVR